MVAVVPQSERDLAKIVYSLRQLSDDFNFVGTWTPTLTFATPGDLNVVYSTRAGLYMKIGRLLIAKFSITTSTFTYSTASGNLTITGLPVAVANIDNIDFRSGSLRWQGITKANYTQIVPVPARDTTTMIFNISGSGQSTTSITTADVPSAGTIDLRGMTEYFTNL